MGSIHQFIALHGHDGALQLELDRRVVDAAASYMASEDSSSAYLFSGWAQAALPHKKLPDEAAWQVSTDRVTLIVEPGRRASPNGPVSVGVPYGSRARLILLYLQSQALKTGSREVSLGSSLRDWLRRMDITPGGNSIAGVREQAERIARCRLSFQIRGADGRSGLVQQQVVDTAMFAEAGDSSSGGFVETVQLSQTFYDQLRRHPVPVEDAAIRAINRHSIALDIYCWLAHRLHVLNEPCEITWRALQAQFGAGTDRLRNFRARFIENLDLALAVYPAAAVETNTRGVILRPSPPPVAKSSNAVLTGTTATLLRITDSPLNKRNGPILGRHPLAAAKPEN